MFPLRQKPTHELSIVHWNCFNMTEDRLIETELFLEEFQPDLMAI